MRVIHGKAKLEDGEKLIKCLCCNSQIAFNPKRDHEVTTTNENEFLFDCPVCYVDLRVDGDTVTVL